MSEVFGARSLIYWWGLFTATAFIKDWLGEFAKLLKNPQMFVPTKIPFNSLPGLNAWIDGAANYIKAAVNFNPDQVIATIGPLSIKGWSIAVLLGALFLYFGIRMYIRALRSPAWFDDFLTIFVLYILLRLEGHIISSTSLPLTDSFRALVDNQGTTFVLILILLISLGIFGEGFRNKRTFWRALIEIALVALFMFPRETANVLGYIVDALGQFGAAITLSTNLPFAAAWGVIGLVLAIQRLTTHDIIKEVKVEG